MSVFDSVLIRKVGRSRFNLSHTNTLSMRQGMLTPILCKEILPGDRFKVSSQHLLRFQPMLAPVFSNMNVYVHYFFVPNRLLWKNWEKFISRPMSDSSPVPPYITCEYSSLQGSGSECLADYLGIPYYKGTQSFSALPFAAYQKIYMDYYRNQALQDVTALDYEEDEPIIKEDGEIAPIIGQSNPFFGALITMRRRNWEKDYFTSCLPSAQQGDGVDIPVHLDGSDLEVKYKNTSTGNPTYVVDLEGNRDTGQGVANTNYLSINGSGGLKDEKPQLVRIDNSENLEVVNKDGEYINTNININDLRLAEKLQQWLENNIKGGTRYIEQILSHFGVVGDDARLQRAQYLGGGQQPVVISEVTSSSATEQAQLGDYAGHGVSYGQSMSFNKRFKEHGFLIGIMSVLPRTTYQDGLSRMWSRTSPLDYYFPEFANLGEQAVLNKELYLRDDSDFATGRKNDDVFGYQQRYAEYKYYPSEVHGDFRTSLRFWTQARLFGDKLVYDGDQESNSPTLNSAFVTAQPTDRIFNVVSENYDKILVNVFHNITAYRKMPRHAYPSI